MLILIRHAHVLFNWEKKYTAEGFAQAQAEYDEAPIERINASQLRSIRDELPEHFELYTSTLKRSIDTAAQLFPDKTPMRLPEFSEIPIYPYRDSDKPLSLWRWLFWGRMQWFCNNPRQERTKQMVKHEIEALMSLYRKQKYSDCRTRISDADNAEHTCTALSRSKTDAHKKFRHSEMFCL